MAILFKYSLFFLSFAPLWISITFVDVKSILAGSNSLCTEYISIACIIIASFISAIVLFSQLKSQGREGSQEHTLIGVREEKAITAEYLLSYILPLFVFNFTLWEQVVLFLIFFVTLAFLCIRHNYFSINIVLEIVGYRFFQCEIENEDKIKTERIIISKQKLNGCKGSEIWIKSLNNEYSLDVSRKN